MLHSVVRNFGNRREAKKKKTDTQQNNTNENNNNNTEIELDEKSRLREISLRKIFKTRAFSKKPYF